MGVVSTACVSLCAGVIFNVLVVVELWFMAGFMAEFRTDCCAMIIAGSEAATDEGIAAVFIGAPISGLEMSSCEAIAVVVVNLLVAAVAVMVAVLFWPNMVEDGELAAAALVTITGLAVAAALFVDILVARWRKRGLASVVKFDSTNEWLYER